MTASGQEPTSLPIAPCDISPPRASPAFVEWIVPGSTDAQSTAAINCSHRWCAELVAAVGEITPLGQPGSQMEDVGKSEAHQDGGANSAVLRLYFHGSLRRSILAKHCATASRSFPAKSSSATNERTISLLRNEAGGKAQQSIDRAWSEVMENAEHRAESRHLRIESAGLQLLAERLSFQIGRHVH